METNNENKNILSEPELRFREELKNCVKRIVDVADAKGQTILLRSMWETKQSLPIGSCS